MKQTLEELYRSMLDEIGEDAQREGLLKTPQRAADAMRYLTRGYQQSVEEIVNGAIFESSNDEMVMVRNIELYSLCEHHMLPFIGKCHVAIEVEGVVVPAGILKGEIRKIALLKTRSVEIVDQSRPSRFCTDLEAGEYFRAGSRVSGPLVNLL